MHGLLQAKHLLCRLDPRATLFRRTRALHAFHKIQAINTFCVKKYRNIKHFRKPYYTYQLSKLPPFLCALEYAKKMLSSSTRAFGRYNNLPARKPCVKPTFGIL